MRQTEESRYVRDSISVIGFELDLPRLSKIPFRLRESHNIGSLSEIGFVRNDFRHAFFVDGNHGLEASNVDADCCRCCIWL